jgi:hypothetical protein
MRRMSAFGVKRTFLQLTLMSTFGTKRTLPSTDPDHFQAASLTRYHAALQDWEGQ